MTGLIAIDESGNLGPAGTRIFSMAAIIMLRPRGLKTASKYFPNDRIEHKWNNTLPSKRRELLTVMSSLKFNAVYCAIDKNHPNNNHPVYGNDLYEIVLRQVVSDQLSVLPCRDFKIRLDSNSFIKLDTFKKIVIETAEKYNVNPVAINKITSTNDRCIQLVDFIAGASRAYHEYDDDSIMILNNKVSIARRL